MSKCGDIYWVMSLFARSPPDLVYVVLCCYVHREESSTGNVDGNFMLPLGEEAFAGTVLERMRALCIYAGVIN